MKSNVAEPESWKRVLDIEVPVEEVEEAITAKVNAYSKKVKIPGFRPGKVPGNVVRSRFGDVIRAETIEELVQKNYENACREQGITPISQGTVNELKAEEGTPLSFKVETEIEPPIEIKGYQKLKIKPSPRKIRASDVDEIVQGLRARQASYNTVERPAKKGDFVKLEYQRVEIDGAERSDVESPEYPVELGTSTVKGFDKALIGASAGDVVEAPITFPKDYGDTDIAGKKGQFTIKVTEVQEQQLPEIDEEFLKKMGDFKDEGQLRERIQKDLEERAVQEARTDAHNKAIEALISSNPFDVPPSQIRRYLDQAYEQQQGRAQQTGQEMPSKEEFDGRFREVGMRAIKRHRIIEYIASKENIKASQEDVDKRIEQMAARYNQPFDQVKASLRRSGMTNQMRDDIREQKTLDYLIGEYDPSAAQS